MISDIQHVCTGCAVCADACPQNCISMQQDGEGFFYPHVDESSCIQCGKCESVCPVLQTKSKANAPSAPQEMPIAYAAYNNDESIRLASSSGGIFTLLAEQTLAAGGVVFGAAMREDQRSVAHIALETPQELDKLRGSKYLQSETNGIYKQVKIALQTGKKVLFSGTPCQVEALRTYLGPDEENLLCMDFICHGVPSPKVWDKYVDFRENRAGATAWRTFFRHKTYGWKTYAVLFEFSNNTTYEQIFGEDLFMQAFLRNACIRPSCHACPFKKLNRASDITLADFWGIENIAPDMDDDKGTSLVLVHSEKGKKALSAIHTQIYAKPVNTEIALRENPAMTQSVSPHKNRTEFFSNLNSLPFDKLVHQYAREQITPKMLATALLRRVGLYSIAKKIYVHMKSILRHRA